MSTVSILGCGWLGLPLAKHLISRGFQVKGSSTRAEKLGELKQAGIHAYQLLYSPEAKHADSDFFQSDVVFVNIPFRRDLVDPQFFVRQIEALAQDVMRFGAPFVIFASSTSIYSDQLRQASEDCQIIPETNRIIALRDAENKLLRADRFATTVLRFAGLIGGERRLRKIVNAEEPLTDPDRPVNLVHLDDCLRIVTQVIEENVRGEILNVVADEHPTRRKLYALKGPPQIALDRSMDRANTDSKCYKIVGNSKLKRLLNYRFVHPDPQEFAS